MMLKSRILTPLLDSKDCVLFSGFTFTQLSYNLISLNCVQIKTLIVFVSFSKYSFANIVLWQKIKIKHYFPTVCHELFGKYLDKVRNASQCILNFREAFKKKRFLADFWILKIFTSVWHFWGAKNTFFQKVPQ